MGSFFYIKVNDCKIFNVMSHKTGEVVYEIPFYSKHKKGSHSMIWFLMQKDKKTGKYKFFVDNEWNKDYYINVGVKEEDIEIGKRGCPEWGIRDGNGKKLKYWDGKEFRDGNEKGVRVWGGRGNECGDPCPCCGRKGCCGCLLT